VKAGLTAAPQRTPAGSPAAGQRRPEQAQASPELRLRLMAYQAALAACAKAVPTSLADFLR
jgi:hypothetical protein